MGSLLCPQGAATDQMSWGGASQSPWPSRLTPQCSSASVAMSVVSVTVSGPALPSGARTATSISVLLPMLYVCGAAMQPVSAHAVSMNPERRKEHV